MAKTLEELAKQAGVDPQEVIKYQSRFPDVKDDAAIGSVIALQRQKQQKTTEQPKTFIKPTKQIQLEQQAQQLGMSVDELKQFVKPIAEAGISISTDLFKEIKKNIEKERQAAKEFIQSQFEPLIDQAKEQGRLEVGGTRALVGALGGQGFDTINMSLIQGAIERSEKRVKELERKRDEALQRADMEYSRLLTEQLAREQERLDKLQQQIFERALDVANLELKVKDLALRENRENFNQMLNMAKFDLDTINTLLRVPKGESVVIGNQIFEGMKEPLPLFRGSDLIKIMQEVPIGQPFTFTDPNTGKTYELVGLQTENPNVQIIKSTDDAGNVYVSLIDKEAIFRGENPLVGQFSLGRIGKTKAAPITLTFKKELSGLIQNIKNEMAQVADEKGKIPVDEYRKLREKFAIITGGEVDTFDEVFPPGTYLNLEDPKAQEYIGGLRTPNQIIGDEDLVTKLKKDFGIIPSN